MKLKALTTGLAALAIGAGVAACGGSSSTGGSDGIVTAPGGGATAPVATTAAPTSFPTPKTGPLSKEPVFSVPTGAAPKTLQIKTLIAGTGPAVKTGDDVFVNYVGKFYKGGKVFDASWKDEPGKTFEVADVGPDAKVIAGWQTGLIGLKQGGRYELIIPPALAYGTKTTNGIPGNSTLVFVIDIDKVYG